MELRGAGQEVGGEFFGVGRSLVRRGGAGEMDGYKRVAWCTDVLRG